MQCKKSVNSKWPEGTAQNWWSDVYPNWLITGQHQTGVRLWCLLLPSFSYDHYKFTNETSHKPVWIQYMQRRCWFTAVLVHQHDWLWTCRLADHLLLFYDRTFEWLSHINILQWHCRQKQNPMPIIKLDNYKCIKMLHNISTLWNLCTWICTSFIKL